jgi:hypothetical protein
MDKMLFGRKFGVNLCSLLDFGTVMMFASFQGAGKSRLKAVFE